MSKKFKPTPPPATPEPRPEPPKATTPTVRELSDDLMEHCGKIRFPKRQPGNEVTYAKILALHKAIKA